MEHMKTCIITGGNSGVGKAAAVQLAVTGHRVIIACRNPERGAIARDDIRLISGNEQVHAMTVDLSSRMSIESFVSEVRQTWDCLDVLIHNAAFFDIAKKQPAFNEDGVETTWATNHVGPVRMTNGLMPCLERSQQGRVILVTSKGLALFPKIKVDLEDPEFTSRRFSVQKAYYQSKFAQVCYLLHLAEKLADTCITVNGVRVTNVKLDSDRYPDVSRFQLFLYSIKSRFSISPQAMARTYTWLATSSDVSEVTGGYFDSIDRPARLSANALSEQYRRRVMELTERYL